HAAIDEIIGDFDAAATDEGALKPKVGVVGEILVKFHPDANNNVVGVIEREGGEAVVPGLIDFLLYCLYNTNFKRDHLGKSAASAFVSNAAIAHIERYRRYMKQALGRTPRFAAYAPARISELAKSAEGVLQLGNTTGEGWFLTAEMLELLHNGVPNIICVQPFACLPNHVTGKGVIKELRRRHPQANIVAVDYDPGASEINQINRIKLMMSVAWEHTAREKEGIKQRAKAALYGEPV
ncbi:MAG: 2-hydroxyglutaryl-CoA dehydratase, partial [Clostridiales bacterium]|nr:2-hydroxyglutaryl-CoA dehydratase [Clostridiales bacterium]